MTAIEAMIYCLGNAEWEHDDDGSTVSRMVLDKNGEKHWFFWDEEFDGEDATPELRSESCVPFAASNGPYRPLTEEDTP